MKKTIVTLLALTALGAFALAGCGNNEEPKAPDKQIKQESKAAIPKAVADTKQQQEELIGKARAKYQEFLKEGAQLMEEAKTKVADGRAKGKDALANLKKQQAMVLEKIAAAKASSGQDWEKAKVELEGALKNLKEAYQKAKAELAG